MVSGIALSDFKPDLKCPRVGHSMPGDTDGPPLARARRPDLYGAPMRATDRLMGTVGETAVR